MLLAMLKKLRLASLAPLVLLIGCASDELPQTAEDTITYTLTRLHGEQDPGVVWDLLPASYQNDIRGWARRFAEGVPSGVYDKVFRVLRQAGIAIKSKGEYLISEPMVRYAMQGLRNADEDETLAVLESIGNSLILLGRSEIATVDKLRNSDLGSFLHVTGSQIWMHGARAYRITGQELGSSLEGLDYKTIESDDTTAKIELTLEGETWTMPFSRVEGLWVPTAMVEAWPKMRQQVEDFLRSLEVSEMKAALKQTEKLLDTLLTDLDEIQATKSRGAFSGAWGKIGMRYGKELKALMGKLPLPW